MNWTALVYGGPMLTATIWFVVDAHKWFKGPKVNIEHRMLGREHDTLAYQANRTAQPEIVHEDSSAGSVSREEGDLEAVKMA